MQLKSLLPIAIALLSFCALPAKAIPLVFQVHLDGPSEEPPHAVPGTGTAAVTIDAAAHTLHVVLDFSGLTAGNTAAHIHVINGPGDVNTADTLGPVATTTPTFPGFPSGATAGTYDNVLNTSLAGSFRAGFITDSGGTTDLAEAALFQGIIEGRAYLNIHTPTFPGGEIRGFLTPAAVPVPATAMLLLGGVLLMSFSLRRDRRLRTAIPG